MVIVERLWTAGEGRFKAVVLVSEESHQTRMYIDLKPNAAQSGAGYAP